MNIIHLSRRAAPLAALAALVMTVAPAQAQAVYHVNLNTSSLSTGYTGPLYLDFQFLDGGDVSNNTATVSNFQFGTGGSAPADDSGAVNPSGTASGGLSSGTITLADDALLNELYQPFTPGSALSFDVSLTTNPDLSPGSSPDAFVFNILDGTQANLPTADPTGADSLVTVDVDSATPAAAAFATLPDANNVTVTPVVTGAAPVPELSSAAPLALCLLGLAGIRLRARRA